MTASKILIPLSALLIAACSTSSIQPTACPAIPSDIMVPPSPLMRIESPEQAPEAIKHNARELLGDRDRLIRFQENLSPYEGAFVAIPNGS